MSKAQISFEFIMIFTLVLFALSGFIYMINNQMQEISKKQEQIVMKSLADSIINEVVLASSFNNNYMRRFEIPAKLFGQDYNMSIQGEYLIINVLENNKARLEYLATLPLYVKGSFVEKINASNLKHCVTKSDFDGIRISQNQASLDVLNSTIETEKEFELYVSLHCVEDAKSFTITIHYDPKMVEIIEAVPVIRNYEFKDKNPLFLDYNLIYNYENSPEHIDENIGRFSYGFLGDECSTGSGNVAMIRFKTLDKTGKTEIKFDERIDENLKILDCTTNKYTKKGLPDTKNNAFIEIV